MIQTFATFSVDFWKLKGIRGLRELERRRLPTRRRTLLSAAMSVTRVLVLLSVLACVAYFANAMVPLPQKFTYGQKTIDLSPGASWTTSSKSSVLSNAISRIRSNIFIFPSTNRPTNYQITVETQSDDENLQFGVGTSPVFMYHHFLGFYPFILTQIAQDCLL